MTESRKNELLHEFTQLVVKLANEVPEAQKIVDELIQGGERDLVCHLSLKPPTKEEANIEEQFPDTPSEAETRLQLENKTFEAFMMSLHPDSNSPSQ